MVTEKGYTIMNCAKGVTDHLGQRFSTVKEMCRAYDMSTSTYWMRVRMRGMSLEEALTTPKDSRYFCKTYIDHKGIEHESFSKMCKAYGRIASTVSLRLHRGWSLERALTEPPHESNHVVCQDHLGRKYFSKKEMCEAWGIEYSTYVRRERAGWSLEKTLTTKVKHYATRR